MNESIEDIFPNRELPDREKWSRPIIVGDQLTEAFEEGDRIRKRVLQELRYLNTTFTDVKLLDSEGKVDIEAVERLHLVPLLTALSEVATASAEMIEPHAEYIAALLQIHRTTQDAFERQRLLEEWYQTDAAATRRAAMQKLIEAQEHYIAALKEALNNQKEQIKCAECGLLFTPTRAGQIYHDRKCAARAGQRRRRHEQRKFIKEGEALKAA